MIVGVEVEVGVEDVVCSISLSCGAGRRSVSFPLAAETLSIFDGFLDATT
jgi:hypothetical protein